DADLHSRKSMSYQYAYRRYRVAVPRICVAALLTIVTSTLAGAQRPGGRDTSMAGMQGMKGVKNSTPAMAMVPDPLGVSMERLGSGTTWIPDAVSLPSRQFSADTWNFMLHGFVFGQFDTQSGPRGGSQVGSLNWGMLMASHELAG